MMPDTLPHSRQHAGYSPPLPSCRRATLRRLSLRHLRSHALSASFHYYAFSRQQLIFAIFAAGQISASAIADCRAAAPAVFAFAATCRFSSMFYAAPGIISLRFFAPLSKIDFIFLALMPDARQFFAGAAVAAQADGYVGRMPPDFFGWLFFAISLY